MCISVRRFLAFLLFIIATPGIRFQALGQNVSCPVLPFTIIDADGTSSPTNVLVTFSEFVTIATATNVANYRITNTLSGASIAVLRAQPLNGHQVLLRTTPPRVPGQNYILVVNRLRDAFRNSVITTNSSIPIVPETVTLLPMDSGYQYYQPIALFGDNPDLGTNWIAPGYNDMQVPWSPGTGIFYPGEDADAVPGPVGTVLSQTDVVITYFRGRFNAPFSPAGAQLNLTHVVNDGAVFYLNGQEIHRFNLPGGPLRFDTPAVALLTNYVRSTATLPPVGLAAGPNVLAVGLHQVAPLDLKFAYGAQLDARVMSYVTGAVFFTSGVADRTVMENEPVTLEATSVAGASFQWQKNSVNIPGATNPAYSLAQVPLSLHGAQFRLAVSNAAGVRLSTNGTLRVIADSNPPGVLSAMLNIPGNTLDIQFSEAVTPVTAMNLAHYTITNGAGAIQPIISAAHTNGTNVSLTLGALTGSGLRLIVSGVRDLSMAGNAISNGVISVGFNDIITRTDTWKYLLINTNQSVQTNYYRLGYDDSASGPHGAWSGPSPAVLHVESGFLAAGWTKSTMLSLTDGNTNRINTFYFRKVMPPSPMAGTVTLRGQVLFDDGVVLYCNGAELARFNMPTGTIAATTQALRGWENTEGTPAFEVTVTNWLAGGNLIAAEVHQNGGASGDVVFGLELNVTKPSEVLVPVPPTPRLNMTRCGSHYFITWPARDVLECADTATGPWRAVTTVSPYLGWATNAGVFYRLRR